VGFLTLRRRVGRVGLACGAWRRPPGQARRSAGSRAERAAERGL